jgi:hypothetical protein
MSSSFVHDISGKLPGNFDPELICPVMDLDGRHSSISGGLTAKMQDGIQESAVFPQIS